MATLAVPPGDPCWPVDDACLGDAWATYDPTVQERAVSLAVQTLRMLTGYRVGGCPTTVRPCRKGCLTASTWRTYPLAGSGNTDGVLNPVSIQGAWVNMACGCNTADCSCGPLCEVTLPGVVGGITEVVLDGAVLDPSAYRVDNHRTLVRVDGECWPKCQDMAAPLTEANTFGVTYLNGIPVDDHGAYAAGVLAREYAKACTTGNCALPQNVTRVVRHGIAMDLNTSIFTTGFTGIREVDVWIRRWNPTNLLSAPQVWSPDLVQTRRTTWEPT